MKRTFVATVMAVLLVHIASAQTVVLVETFEGAFPQDNGWTVETSSEMRNWTTLTNFTAGDFTFEMLERSPVAGARRFYRAFVR